MVSFKGKIEQILQKNGLKSTIHRLGKVAFKGLLDDSKKLVFSPDDFKEDPSVITDGCELGIIACTESFGIYDPLVQRVSTKTSIEFYHKVAQEHAAEKIHRPEKQWG